MFYTAVLKTWPKKYVLYIVGIFFFFFFFPLTFGISKPVSGFIFNRPPKTYIMLTLGKALNLLNCRWCYSAEERRCIGEPPCITMCNWENELLKKNKKTEQSANPAFFFKERLSHHPHHHYNYHHRRHNRCHPCHPCRCHCFIIFLFNRSTQSLWHRARCVYCIIIIIIIICFILHPPALHFNHLSSQIDGAGWMGIRGGGVGSISNVRTITWVHDLI